MGTKWSLILSSAQYNKTREYPLVRLVKRQLISTVSIVLCETIN